MSTITIDTRFNTDYIRLLLPVATNHEITQSAPNRIVLQARGIDFQLVLLGQNLTGDPSKAIVNAMVLRDDASSFITIAKLNASKADVFAAFDSGDPTLIIDLFDDISFRGNDGKDTVLTGRGNDEINGQDGNDDIRAQDGDDLLSGGNGNDTLVGGRGNDTLRAQVGRDDLFGSAGDDFLQSGQGQDRLSGGDGRDTFQFLSLQQTAKSLAAADNVTDWSGQDVLSISAQEFGGGLEAGEPLQPNQFRGNSEAKGDHGQFLYDKANDALAWDADGEGNGAAVFVVKFLTNVNLQGEDLTIV